MNQIEMIAAILYLVALQLCSSKTIKIKKTNSCLHILTARNADVSHTIMGVTDLKMNKLIKK